MRVTHKLCDRSCKIMLLRLDLYLLLLPLRGRGCQTQQFIHLLWGVEAVHYMPIIGLFVK